MTINAPIMPIIYGSTKDNHTTKEECNKSNYYTYDHIVKNKSIKINDRGVSQPRQKEIPKIIITYRCRL